MAELTVVDDVPTEVAACTGRRLCFDGTAKGDNVAQRRVTEVVWIREGKGYLLQLQGGGAGTMRWSRTSRQC